MNRIALLVHLAALTWIGLLPRLFFRPGRLTTMWWLTALPFFVAAAVLALAVTGFVESPLTQGELLTQWLSLVSVFGSLIACGLMAASAVAHRVAPALWHQSNDEAVDFICSGPYRYIRHPFYSAYLLVLLSAMLCFPNPVIGAVFVYACLLMSYTADKEERNLLTSRFGAIYAEYCASTGRFFPRWTGKTR